MSLISVGDPVPLRNLTEIVLDALPEEYVPIVTAVNSKEDLCSLDEIESCLLARESRLEKNRKSVLTKPVSVNLTHAQPLPSLLMSEHLASSAESSPNFPIRTSHVTANAEIHGYSSRVGRIGRGGGGGRFGRVQCQICHKPGHDASICYHRYSCSDAPSFQPQRAFSNLFMMATRPKYPSSCGYSAAPRSTPLRPPHPQAFLTGSDPNFMFSTISGGILTQVCLTMSRLMLPTCLTLPHCMDLGRCLWEMAKV